MHILIRTICIILLLSSLPFAKGVPAGTKIMNQAHLTYQVQGVDFNATSNHLTNIVDQLIELEIVCQSVQNIVVINGEKKSALPFKLENLGNGTDNFSLIPDTNASTPEVDNRLIYEDKNGDGVFNSGDLQVNSIDLDADDNITLFFVSDIPDTATWKYSYNGIEARSTIGGSGIKGEEHNTTDSSGLTYYAVDGYRGGVDSALCTYEMSDLSFKLEKSSTFEGKKLKTGSVIHYKIDVKVLGTGKVSNIVVKDPIPTGTIYQPGTIKLDGTVLSDGGHIVSNVITVPIVDMTKAGVHVITFDVKVK